LQLYLNDHIVTAAALDQRNFKFKLINNVTPIAIVGMRFHAGARDALIEISQKTWNGNQQSQHHLFLLPDLNNEHDENAICLHNGKQILGFVPRQQSSLELNDWELNAYYIKRHLQEVSAFLGYHAVMCVRMPLRIQKSEEGLFKRRNFLKVDCYGYIDERIARKYLQSVIEGN